MQQQLRFLWVPRSRRALLGLCVTAFLTACGGGGGGGSGGAGPAPTVAATPTSYTELANLCAKPRLGTVDRQGTLAQEKAFLRAFIQETYLWYRDVPDPDPAGFATVLDYFDALKTPKLNPLGRAVDRFHFWDVTEDWNAGSSGFATEYGIRWLYLSDAIPRNWVVAEVAPGSSAALAGVKRGDRLTAIDGADFVNGRTATEVDILNAGLFAKVGVAHQFAFNFAPALSLTRTQFAYDTVHDVKTIQSGAATVGYFRFDRHIAKSEAELVAAIQTLKNARVTDLVIDMRYNGGGLLSIANKLAYMVAGPAATQGKTFERLLFNDKLSATEDYSIPFYNPQANDPPLPPLPHLDLQRVTILVTDQTASASESVINSLRGVNVQVDLVGQTTLGKPYGFYPQDNCGYTYFAIQFKGVNHKGFGDYEDGFTPTCSAPDDYTHPLGDSAEAMLATALSHRQSGSCPAVARSLTAAAAATATPVSASPRTQSLLGTRPGAAQELLRRPETPHLRILEGTRP